MILVHTADKTDDGLLKAVVFADQLHAAGYEPVVDKAGLPEDLRPSLLFHILPHLRDLSDTPVLNAACIGTEISAPEAYSDLRHLTFAPEAAIYAFGQFETPQDRIAATARLTYATGHQPMVTDLTEMPTITAGSSNCPCFGVDIPKKEMPYLNAQKAITVVVSEIEDPVALNGLQFLTTSRNFNALCYMSGQQKSEWMRSFRPGGHIYGFSEISPAALSAQSDALVLTGPIGNNQNALCLLNNMLMSGTAIIDATPDGQYEQAGLPVHRGPVDLGYLQMYLSETILPNLEGIQQSSRGKAAAHLHPLTQFFEDVPRAQNDHQAQTQPPKLHFMPTNGHGLGHAQRCVLIGEALAEHNVQPEFFAFPSCLPMIGKAGFDATPLVSRSGLHDASEANDLANQARLRSKVSTGDVLAFDGGYVFDSVIRTIVEKRLRSVWIRRGLWRATQDNRIPMDREKYFERVIVPREAFDELNMGLSMGPRIHDIGPIVRQIKTTKSSNNQLRKRLAKEFGTSFDKLVVTMLGSGVSHDLSANVQAVCNAVEQREDCLNLIVVWPSSVVPAERFAWTRSKVVKSMSASWLAAHADLMVSAAGYNSFHEAMYNNVPTIFVPQVHEMLDEQDLRAEAAEKLGLCAHVPAAKLSQLDRELRSCLDGSRTQDIRAALKAYSFPEPGNAEAASLLAEVMQ